MSSCGLANLGICPFAMVDARPLNLDGGISSSSGSEGGTNISFGGILGTFGSKSSISASVGDFMFIGPCSLLFLRERLSGKLSKTKLGIRIGNWKAVLCVLSPRFFRLNLGDLWGCCIEAEGLERGLAVAPFWGEVPAAEDVRTPWDDFWFKSGCFDIVPIGKTQTQTNWDHFWKMAEILLLPELVDSGIPASLCLRLFCVVDNGNFRVGVGALSIPTGWWAGELFWEATEEPPTDRLLSAWPMLNHLNVNSFSYNKEIMVKIKNVTIELPLWGRRHQATIVHFLSITRGCSGCSGCSCIQCSIFLCFFLNI